jgi:hypothetical protein
MDHRNKIPLVEPVGQPTLLQFICEFLDQKTSRRVGVRIPNNRPARGICFGMPFEKGWQNVDLQLLEHGAIVTVFAGKWGRVPGRNARSTRRRGITLDRKGRGTSWPILGGSLS